MTPRDVLAQLEAEGVKASLKLRFEGEREPSPEVVTLLENHRDDLITYLASQGSNTPQMCRLSESKESDAVWCRRCYRHHLRPCQPSDKVLGRPG